MSETLDIVVSGEQYEKIANEAHRLNMSIDDFFNMVLSKHLDELEVSGTQPVADFAIGENSNNFR